MYMKPDCEMNSCKRKEMISMHRTDQLNKAIIKFDLPKSLTEWEKVGMRAREIIVRHSRSIKL